MNHTKLGVLMAIAGCVSSVEPDVTTTTQPVGNCPIQLCNSPEVAHYGIWEQNLFGEADSNGISIRSLDGVSQIVKAGLSYDLTVREGRIYGLRPNTPTLGGLALEGARIELMNGKQRYYDITITRVRKSGTSFVAGAPGEVETYKMVWHEPGTASSTGKLLCNSPLQPTTDNKTYELLGMLPDETLVFEGDRYDVSAMTTEEKGDDAWFNFGCAGHTLAKLYLNRSTIHTQPAPDWALRQTMLKMLVADYCGTGQTFTLAGEPLVWKGGLQTAYAMSPGSIDARWDEHGAICVGEPRLVSTTNPQAATLFPDVESMIKNACHAANHPVQPCTNLDVEDLDRGLVISANR